MRADAFSLPHVGVWVYTPTPFFQIGGGSGVVVVYNYLTMDPNRRIPVLAPFKRTRLAIQKIGGEPLVETAEEVSLADVDTTGCYVPRVKMAKMHR